MNRAAIERDLYSLLPGLTSALPPDLVELATSLLAQSRSKAGSLKQEEEIARSYVCANIACERLKTKLDLPDIKPRPPCPLRIYKRLFQYLSSALASTRTPNKRSYDDANNSNNHSAGPSNPSTPSKRTARHAQPLTPTPSRSRTTNTPRTSRIAIQHSSPKSIPAKTTTQSTNTQHITSQTTDDDFPPWLMRYIRTLCTTLSLPARLAPHLFTATTTLARQQQPDKGGHMDDDDDDDVTVDELPALVFATAALVARDRWWASMTTAEYTRRQREAHALIRHVATSSSSSSSSSLLAVVDDVKAFTQQAEAFLARAESENWREMEWYVNVLAIVDHDETTNGDAMTARGRRWRRAGNDDSDESNDDDDNDSEEIGKLGGGEMTMYATDWLTTKRRREYKAWEKGMRERIRHIIGK